MVLLRVWLLPLIIMSMGLNLAIGSSALLSRSAPFSLHGKELQSIWVHKTFYAEDSLTGRNIPFNPDAAIFGLRVDAKIRLFNDASLVRIILIDNKSNEYLIYETYSLLCDDYSFSVRNACQETKILAGVTPASVQVEVLDASVDLQKISFISSVPFTQSEIIEYQDRVREEQRRERIDLLNVQIKKKGMAWVAGSTALSFKTYSEKKCLFGRLDRPLGNLQGFEYYAGGIFDLKSSKAEVLSQSDMPAAHALVDTFDWRSRHGAVNQQSPYYDGDKLGGGWATSVKNQSVPQNCGSCWAHSTCATAEMRANLYYNRHYDLNLAEQFLMACSCDEVCEVPGKPCSGGWSTDAARWLVTHGVTDEVNFPYQASDNPKCGDSATNPKEHFRFANGIYSRKIPSEDSLKQFLVHWGPLNVEILSMWHCMCLVGYTKEASTGKAVWIYKNSYGTSQGVNGYSFLKTAMSDIRSADAFLPPAVSKRYTDDSIRCADLDKDGYYNWGIGPKPATCPDGCSDEEDCDDSRGNLGPMLQDGSCKKINTGMQLNALQDSQIRCYYSRSPYNGLTILYLKIPDGLKATIQIYDVSGALIKNLQVNNGNNELRQLRWDGTNEQGRLMSGGIYICRVALDTIRKKSPTYFKIMLSL